MPPGNLATSLLLASDLPPATIAQLGFVAGLAVARALDTTSLGPGRFTLKWPNDVLADGAKLVGIMLQTELVGPTRAVVIGIGVNVAAAPEGLPYRAASLHALGATVTAEELFEALSAAMVDMLAEWDHGRGFDRIRRAWLARAAGLGGAVSVKAHERVLQGTFETIDEHGQLVVREADGALRRISAGDVHFGNTATVRAESVA